MSRKLSRINFALAFFALALLFSVIGLFMMVSVFHPVYVVDALKLDQKPDRYIVLENPESSILEAISCPRISVEVKSFENLPTFNALIAHGTFNVEYNGDYYFVGFAVGDKFPPPLLPLFLLAGIIVSASAVVILVCVKVAYHFRKPKMQPQT